MSVYNPNIPSGPSNLSQSQAQMLDNFSQLNTQFAIDHTAFNTGSGNGDGFHKKVTLATKTAAGSQVDPSSAIYTQSGTASTVAQPFYRNQNGIFPLSIIKAWGVFDAGLSLTQTYNVASITKSAAGQYIVTLTALAVTSATFGVIMTNQMQSNFTVGGIGGVSSLSYNGSNQGVFQINVKSLTSAVGVDEYPVSFIVLQI